MTTDDIINDELNDELNFISRINVHCTFFIHVHI